jgi:hypothetical protein
MFRLASLLCFLPIAVLGCECQTSYSACNEFGISDLVFVGTVESIEPIFLSRWNLSNPAILQSLNAAWIEAQQHQSEEALNRLKELCLRNFPDAADEIRSAKTVESVGSLFYTALNHGMKVTFKVRTLFKHDDEAEKSYDVWTPFGDCGIDFQTGETYLVYADNDEASGLLSTTRCTRTKRLTDAGEDLAYLYFRKEDKELSARLEGFATTDRDYQLDLTKMHDPDSVKAPAPGVVVQLRSDHLTRYAETDNKGRYVFDGLAEGDYNVSAFAGGYPARPKLLAGPRSVHLDPGGCGQGFLLLPLSPETNP